MNVTYTTEQIRLRSEAREWFTANTPKSRLIYPGNDEDYQLSRRWERQLYEAGWSVVNWPTEYGGRGASIIDWLIVEDEYHRAGGPYRVAMNGISLLGPALFNFGTLEQRTRHLIPMARAEVVWAQAWSEPSSGSDLASLRSTASPTEGGWRLNGSKIWSSHAPHADWAFGLFRTDTAEERHKGLTYFLIDLQSDGVTVAPIRRLDGRPSFGQIFFDNVWVPDINVLGAVGMGWKVAMSTTGSERGFSLRSPSRFRVAAEKLLARVISANDACPAGVVEEAVDAYLDAEAYELRTLWAASELMAGRSLGAEMSCDKLFWSDLDIRLSDLSLSLRYLTGLGTERARASLTEELNTYVTALPGTIWGGTDEIQRDIVAQRVLGLPRSDR